MNELDSIRGENLIWAGISALAAVALCAQMGLLGGTRGTGAVDAIETGRVAMAGSVHQPDAEPTSDVAPGTSGDLLVEAVVLIESGGRPDSVGRHGERGLMQIRAATWREVTQDEFGVAFHFDKAFDPALNRKVGRAYLDKLGVYVDRNRHRWQTDRRSLLLACYNAGPSRVRAAGFGLQGLPASTRDYVTRAAALHDALVADHEDAARVARIAAPAGQTLLPRGS